MYFWRALLLVIYLHVLHLRQSHAAPTASTSSSAVIIATPTPLVIPPSQLLDGNDGPWSSFFLRVGSPPQTVRVLVSTSSNQPLVVFPEGCSSSESPCDKDRGGLFQRNASTTWTPNNSTTGGMYAVALNSNIGMIPEVQYGSDTLALSYLGSGTPALTRQLVGGVTTTDLFTGVFGLNPAATNFSSGIPEVASYMSNLKVQNLIPSLSYGYNAGNSYRFNSVLASLTLCGFDSSLFERNNLIFTFAPQSTFDLNVNVKSITQTSLSGNVTGNSTLSSTTFSAFIDSTTPYLWLPDDVCTRFENAFGLAYDNTSGLYLVNDTLHFSLLAQNANITFTLGNATSSETANIVLPYAAFDLIASWPLVETPTRYFPLKRANSASEITLGRTFLQEAYLIADYERSIFSVSKMKWDPNASAEITSIAPPPSSSSTTSAESGTRNREKKSNSVPTTTIVAATICGAVFLTVLVASIVIIRQRQKKLEILAKSPPTPALSDTFPTTSIPGACENCHSTCPSPEPGAGAGAGTGTQSTVSTQSSSMENDRRRSTPILSGLSLPPISPISPIRTGQEDQFSQMLQISPTSPGPVIPPRFSGLDRVTSPASFHDQVPEVADNIYELPAREEVAVEMVGTPVESILQQALDNIIAQHNIDSQTENSTQLQSYVPYQPLSPKSAPARAQNERRWALHSPVYGFKEEETQQQLGAQAPINNPRASKQLHSPVYGVEEEQSQSRPQSAPTSQAPPTSSTLTQGHFTFDIDPSPRPLHLRTRTPTQPPPGIQIQIRPPTQTRRQTLPPPQLSVQVPRQTLPPPLSTQMQVRRQTLPASLIPSYGSARGRGRDLIREHQEQMSEWERMRGPPVLWPEGWRRNLILEHQERMREWEKMRGPRPPPTDTPTDLQSTAEATTQVSVEASTQLSVPKKTDASKDGDSVEALAVTSGPGRSTGQSRNLMLEHQERMREWERMRGPKPAPRDTPTETQQTTSSLPATKPAIRPVTHIGHLIQPAAKSREGSTQQSTKRMTQPTAEASGQLSTRPAAQPSTQQTTETVSHSDGKKTVEAERRPRGRKRGRNEEGAKSSSTFDRKEYSWLRLD